MPINYRMKINVYLAQDFFNNNLTNKEINVKYKILSKIIYFYLFQLNYRKLLTFSQSNISFFNKGSFFKLLINKLNYIFKSIIELCLM